MERGEMGRGEVGINLLIEIPELLFQLLVCSYRIQDLEGIH